MHSECGENHQQAELLADSINAALREKADYSNVLAHAIAPRSRLKRKGVRSYVHVAGIIESESRLAALRHSITEVGQSSGCSNIVLSTDELIKASHSNTVIRFAVKIVQQSTN